MLTSCADANVQLGLPILDAENEATDYPWPVQLMSIPGEDDLEELGPVVAIACGLDSSYVTMQVCVCVCCGLDSSYVTASYRVSPAVAVETPPVCVLRVRFLCHSYLSAYVSSIKESNPQLRVRLLNRADVC